MSDEHETNQPQYPPEYVLVACPTYRGKHYALEAYLRAYNDFSYPNRSLFIVDNTSDGLGYYEHLLKCNVPCAHINPTKEFQETFAMCWKKILERALELNFQWILSLEQDNIAPPLTLDILLNVANYCKALHVAHSYRWHLTQSQIGTLMGLGCNLIHVDLLEAIFNQPKWATDAFESELYEYPKLHHLPSVELHSLIDIQHLDDEVGAEFNQFSYPGIPERTKGSTAVLEPIPYKITPADLARWNGQHEHAQSE